MDGSTETLLIVLITLISTLTIVALAMVIAAVVAINKLIKKIQLASDTAVDTMASIKQQVVKPLGLFGAARYMYKLIKRK
jgi:hypothetical protein